MTAGRAELTLRAPAKLNLYLAVLGRRPDGYHELVTVMQALDLCDELRLRLVPRAGVSLALAQPAPGVPEGSENLALRAAELVLERAGAAGDLGVELRLDKRIPAGGGLGGGSSDAAAALVGVNRLLGTPLEPAALSALAARLGSDVTFFLHGGTALCTGRGEIVQPIEAPRPFDVTLLLPPFATPTPVYAALHADRGGAPALAAMRREPARDTPDLHTLQRAVADADVEGLEYLFRNDLEAPARTVEPRLAALLDRTRLHLSGSGSTLFGYGRRAAELAAECPPTSICLARSRSGNP
jgi:4-diphosphocytidyl-2-C-methyl-D-erythritol kinase